MGILSTPDKEKVKRAVPKASNKIIDATVARLYVAHPDTTEWTYTGLSGAIALVDDLVGHTFFLKLVDIQGARGVLWDQELYVDFLYHQDRTFFHTFELEECLAGLLFEDTQDAAHFYKRVSTRHKHGLKQTVNNKNAVALKGKMAPETQKTGSRGEYVDVSTGQRSRRAKGVLYYDGQPPAEWRLLYLELAAAGISEDMIAENRDFIKSYIAKQGGPLVGLEPPIPRRFKDEAREEVEVSRVNSGATKLKKAPPPPPPVAVESSEPSPVPEPVSLPEETPEPEKPRFRLPPMNAKVPPSLGAPPSVVPPPVHTNAPAQNTPMQSSSNGPPAPPPRAPGRAVPPPPPPRAAAQNTGRGVPPPPPPRARALPTPPAQSPVQANPVQSPVQPTFQSPAPQTQSFQSPVQQSVQSPVQNHAPPPPARDYNPVPIQNLPPPPKRADAPSGVASPAQSAPPPPPLPPQSTAPLQNAAPPPPPLPPQNAGIPPPPPTLPQNSAAPPPPPLPQHSESAAPALPAVDGSRDALLASIRGAGVGGLKKTDKSALEKPNVLLQEARGEPVQVSSAPAPAGQPESLADALASALNKRKGKVAESDDDDNDDDW